MSSFLSKVINFIVLPQALADFEKASRTSDCSAMKGEAAMTLDRARMNYWGDLCMEEQRVRRQGTHNYWLCSSLTQFLVIKSLFDELPYPISYPGDLEFNDDDCLIVDSLSDIAASDYGSDGSDDDDDDDFFDYVSDFGDSDLESGDSSVDESAAESESEYDWVEPIIPPPNFALTEITLFLEETDRSEPHFENVGDEFVRHEIQTDMEERAESLASPSTAGVSDDVSGTDSDGDDDGDLVLLGDGTVGNMASSYTSEDLNGASGTELDDDWDIVEREVTDPSAPSSIAPVQNDVADAIDDADWDPLADGEIVRQETSVDEADETSPPATADDDDRHESVHQQRAEMDPNLDLPRPTAPVNRADDVEEKEEKEKEERRKELLRRSNLNWADDVEEEEERKRKEEEERKRKEEEERKREEEEQEEEERVRQLLRPSISDSVDEADEGEGEGDDAAVPTAGNFPRDSNGSPETQAAPSSSAPVTDDEGPEEATETLDVAPAAPHDEEETEENAPEQEGSLAHHYNCDGNPVFEPSNTPPVVSLLVQVVGPKRLGRCNMLRLRSIMHRAYLFIDPVSVMLGEGERLQTKFGSVMELLRYAAGRTFKVYSNDGAWAVEPQPEGELIINEEMMHVNQPSIISNRLLPRKLSCCPSYIWDRVFTSRREEDRRRRRGPDRSWAPRPSPLKQVLRSEDLPPLEGQLIDLSSSDQEECKWSDDLRDIDLGYNHPEGKLSEPQKSEFKPDFRLGESRTDGLDQDHLPCDPEALESRIATPIESPKSDSLGMGWVEDFTSVGPEPDCKVDGLGHNNGIYTLPGAQVSVCSLLLDQEPTPAPEDEYVVIDYDEDLPSSLYSREIDEARVPHETDSANESDIKRLSSSDFLRLIYKYSSIVADEFETASFDEDAREVSDEEIPAMLDLAPSQQPSSSPEEPSVVPLPLSPTRRPNAPRRRTHRARAGITRHEALRHRVSPLRTRLPPRRSLSTMAGKYKRRPNRKEKKPLSEVPEVPAAPEHVPSLTGSECRFPTDYDSFSQLGVEPPRRRSRPLAFMKKYISKVRDGTRALLQKSKKGLAGMRKRESGEGSEGKAGRKLTKRRK